MLCGRSPPRRRVLRAHALQARPTTSTRRVRWPLASSPAANRSSRPIAAAAACFLDQNALGLGIRRGPDMLGFVHVREREARDGRDARGAEVYDLLSFEREAPLPFSDIEQRGGLLAMADLISASIDDAASDAPPSPSVHTHDAPKHDRRRSRHDVLARPRPWP